MNLRDFLNNLISAKEKRAAELRKLIKESNDANEVRALGETLEAVLEELRAAKDQLAGLDEDDGDEGQPGNEGRSNPPAAPERPANPMREFRSMAQYGQQQPGQADDPTNTAEYRSAFRDFVMRGVVIPAEVRANTMTTDVTSVIPTVVINKIIEKMDEVGTILNLVTRTSYAAGVEIPTSATKPVATWVSEGAGSDKQKKTTGKITFTYFKLRCEVSVSMEVHTMSLEAFETKLAENVANAMVKAIEAAIINGTGAGQPKGILAAEVPAEQTITIPAAGWDYETLCKAEGAVPETAEGTAVWCMSKKNFMACLAMTDDKGQPIARVNYGINGKPERVLLGRQVVTTSVMTNAEKPAFIFDFADYILNTIYDLGIQRKQDWDTEDMLTKAVMSCDGKVVDNTSLVVLKQAA